MEVFRKDKNDNEDNFVEKKHLATYAIDYIYSNNFTYVSAKNSQIGVSTENQTERKVGCIKILKNDEQYFTPNKCREAK